MEWLQAFYNLLAALFGALNPFVRVLHPLLKSMATYTPDVRDRLSPATLSSILWTDEFVCMIPCMVCTVSGIQF